MDLLPAESRVIMALEAIKNDEKLSVRAAAKLYNVSDRTIRRNVHNGVTNTMA
jgi:DeoR/GlpR family transcriptional regulator of sugar metabolism